ncbi:putative cyclin-dependent serine/threonine-protein kinase DDB_G0272797/DDB_G0274007 isoform X2 [Drosophila guanche]|uniref:Blast:Larval cuticle protein A3A n=1 Tax=Drosophila guanche TaxID=7266 RepID=A0A3B0JBI1_DROGU|nr:putative cyclin-dependent serine/threonine-protein kinase DDB_G0272797/DDB_G0274007 isoform X2 [Drosophila guanche]SPP77392.1 blast:Larval cuticle protein A3A [Drosophila guanche]
MQMQLFLVVATAALCVAITQAQQQGGVDPAYLRQYYQQLQQQQQSSSQGAETPIYEQNSEQTQQYVNAGQQIRVKDTVAEQIRAQQQQQQQQQQQPQGYVAPSLRDYQPQYQSQQQPQSVYRQQVQQAAPAPPPRRVQQPAYQAPSLLGKGQQKLSLQQRQQQQQQQEEEEYDDQNSSYQFGFDVKDDEFTNYQNRKEVRDGSVIKGSYSVVDSDGFIRTVKYTADPKEGFKAEVIREPTDIVVKIPTQPPATQLLRASGHKGQQEYSPSHSHSHSPGKQQYQQHQQQPQYHQYQ